MSAGVGTVSVCLGTVSVCVGVIDVCDGVSVCGVGGCDDVDVCMSVRVGDVCVCVGVCNGVGVCDVGAAMTASFRAFRLAFLLEKGGGKAFLLFLGNSVSEAATGTDKASISSVSAVGTKASTSSVSERCEAIRADFLFTDAWGDAFLF